MIIEDMNINSNVIYENIDWIKRKLIIQNEPITQFPRIREIWWISLGYNVGVEINGKNFNYERPAIVVKVLNSESLFVIPITSSARDNRYYVSFINEDGLVKSASISQLRMISSKRLNRKMEELSEKDFVRVTKALHGLLCETETPA